MAMEGLPANRIFMGFLHFHQSLIMLKRSFLLEAADPVYEKLAVQMVVLVENNPGKQAFGFEAENLTPLVSGLNFYRGGAFYQEIKAGE